MKLNRKKITRTILFIVPLILLRCVIEIYRFSANGEIPYALLNAFLWPMIALCIILMICLLLFYYEKYIAVNLIILLTIVVLVFYKINAIQPVYNETDSGKYERLDN